ncbi:Hypothetical protein CINCED_3A011973 [Cinara cedri]|uniref:Uncharacterized protein n=1 Tax=Cinara cedri TaxID=506608 RepID=A0A5E4N963_9HEMI|nr:Hypothetical protein CINCED_3A011973 [Cinara cedri]
MNVHKECVGETYVSASARAATAVFPEKFGIVISASPEAVVAQSEPMSFHLADSELCYERLKTSFFYTRSDDVIIKTVVSPPPPVTTTISAFDFFSFNVKFVSISEIFKLALNSKIRVNEEPKRDNKKCTKDDYMELFRTWHISQKRPSSNRSKRKIEDQTLLADNNSDTDLILGGQQRQKSVGYLIRNKKQ